MNKIKLTFHGGAGSVTGANFLVEDYTSGVKFLVDCGLFQGRQIGDDKNRLDFPYNPASIDYLFITHAHIDHIGRIPKLVHDGFRGKIISTMPTKEIAKLMLEDSLGVLKKEARWNKQKILYTSEDINQAMRLWQGVPYHDIINVQGGFQATMKDAGHILGSAMFEFERDGKKMVFTGDLGNSPTILLKDTEVIDDADYIIMESVYGDRNHDPVETRRSELRDVIISTINDGGALMIPAFSLERTQELLYEINELVENKKIPSVPIFLDSPLAIKVTNIYKENEEHFNKKTQDIIKGGDDIFNFPNLKKTLKTEESKKIAEVPNPKVIIAGSGMSNGGRIIHHEKRHLPDPKSTLLIIGHQSPRTLGRSLVDGIKNVKIMGTQVKVNAQIKSIRSFSAHKDHDGLVEFVSHSKDKVKTIFCVMGEPKSSMFLAQELQDYLEVDARVPKQGDAVDLEI